jgi:IS6 family transposase
VQRYAPELDRRVRQELKRTGTSWRVDETYIRVAGRWMYLYRAVDSCPIASTALASKYRIVSWLPCLS